MVALRRWFIVVVAALTVVFGVGQPAEATTYDYGMGGSESTLTMESRSASVDSRAAQLTVGGLDDATPPEVRLRPARDSFAPNTPGSPDIMPSDVTGKTRTEIRQLAGDKGSCHAVSPIPSTVFRGSGTIPSLASTAYGLIGATWTNKLAFPTTTPGPLLIIAISIPRSELPLANHLLAETSTFLRMDADMSDDNELEVVNVGGAYCFVDQEVVMLKAVDCHGDPVELDPTEAERLGRELIRLARESGA